MEGPVVLPEDVRIVPLIELPPEIREQVSGQDADFALTRPLSRVPSKVIDADAAALLEEFRQPKTIVDAILAYSRKRHTRPTAVLEDAYPLIESCLYANLLVKPGETAKPIRPTFRVGEMVAGNRVEAVVQVLQDSEVYRVTTPTGCIAAMKITRAEATPLTTRMLDREQRILEILNGDVSPKLLGAGQLSDGRQFLLTEWVEGADCQSFIQELRNSGRGDAESDVELVCASILHAYARLHRMGVVHADIHPRNVLVSEDGVVTLIDFGLARKQDDPEDGMRAGVGFFFEPEYAAGILRRDIPPAATVAGEQYSLAALVYFLLSGAHYLHFNFERNEMLRQIAEEEPAPLHRFAHLDAVLSRALRKRPEERFHSTYEFAHEFSRTLSHGAAKVPAGRSGMLEQLQDRVMEQISDPGRALDYNGPRSPSASVTYGAAGIAFALYRIACARNDMHLLALADAWAERAAAEHSDAAFYSEEVQITPDIVGRISPYHTASGVAAVQAHIANARGDFRALEQAAGRFVHEIEGECENPDLALGRAGALLALTRMLEAAGSDEPGELLELGNQLADELRWDMCSEPEIPNSRKITYLGMAHGWAGILYAVLRWDHWSGARPDAVIEARLRQLAGIAEKSRGGLRWPLQTGGAGAAFLHGWCNGSAGYVPLWTLASRVFASEAFLRLAEGAALDAFHGGGGGHGLCCGFAGQAYAQLNLYRATGESQWLERARDLAERAAAFSAAQRERNEPSLPFSLYKGDVGVAVLAAELETPQFACVPFFGEEGWPPRRVRKESTRDQGAAV